MGESILIPLFISALMLSMVVELADLAEDSSVKIVGFATSMNDAIDCAIGGIDISYCSPELAGYSFENETKESLKIMESMQEELSKELNSSKQIQ